MYCIRVVVPARALEAGAKLSLADVEVVQVHAGAVLEGAFETVEDIVGLVTTVQRLLGDQVTADMCDPKDRLATRRRTRWPRPSTPTTAPWPPTSTRLPAWPGCFAPETLYRPSASSTHPAWAGWATSGPPAPSPRLCSPGSRCLRLQPPVPYELRYRELNTEDSGSLVFPVMPSSGDREKGVIVLGVPVQRRFPDPGCGPQSLCLLRQHGRHGQDDPDRQLCLRTEPRRRAHAAGGHTSRSRTRMGRRPPDLGQPLALPALLDRDPPGPGGGGQFGHQVRVPVLEVMPLGHVDLQVRQVHIVFRRSAFDQLTVEDQLPGAAPDRRLLAHLPKDVTLGHGFIPFHRQELPDYELEEEKIQIALEELPQVPA